LTVLGLSIRLIFMSNTQAALVLLHDYYDDDHLVSVRSEMLTLGAPELRGVVQEDCIYLLEGCHRARAAVELGLTIKIIPINYDCDRDDDRTLAELIGTECDSYGRYVVGVCDNDRLLNADVELLNAEDPYLD